ncbi:hypothetical protein NHX12_018302 [Muraenolepis orangiensis]|uniref:Uncharacterized protein n=1 Tax=Muraenolepis orangiensis TaxID=630683 RepID=A0A9Q0F0M6_9TELE|nr:hypothetical protein NHX12_018302 [Muraenolepis orangiensis]
MSKQTFMTVEMAISTAGGDSGECCVDTRPGARTVQPKNWNHLMEKKKRQEDKTKRDATQKKAADQTTKVPEPAPARLSSGPSRHHLHPFRPAVSLSTSSSSGASSGNGKRAPAAGKVPNPTPPQQQQCQPSSASPRYLHREVPPRFRHQELKQQLKRGQPLPAASLGGPTLPNSSTSDAPNAAKRLPGKRPTFIIRRAA